MTLHAVSHDVVASAGRVASAIRRAANAPSSGRRRTASIALCVLALFAACRSFVVEPVRVSSQSMEPTLSAGQTVLVDKMTYRFRNVRVGDVVEAQIPKTGERVIKRVVALGGDDIGIEDGVLVRNGRPVRERYTENEKLGGRFFGPIHVPLGHVFLLGDRRLDSVDSRRFGPIPRSAVRARIIRIL